MMPEMDGITLIQRVRAEVESAPLILMITAISDDDARQELLEAGADEFLTKPYRSTADSYNKCNFYGKKKS
jgi:DNA-binding response OmpR family regulator